VRGVALHVQAILHGAYMRQNGTKMLLGTSEFWGHSSRQAAVWSVIKPSREILTSAMRLRDDLRSVWRYGKRTFQGRIRL